VSLIRIDARRLIPGRGDPIDDGSVVLDGATITYAGTTTDAPATPGAVRHRVDTVMPGMWDCHCHLFGALSMELNQLFLEPVAHRAARASRDLERALQAGVTSVREAGGMGIHLKRAVAEGSIPGPRVYAPGAILSTTGGHGDLHGVPLDWVHELARTDTSLRLCDGADSCMTAVREQLREGADVIKICASGGVLSERDHPIHQQFTDAELRAIVEVAGLAERAVMAHCHGKPGMLAAIEAGVRTIEHGTYLDDEVAAAMVERDVLLVPTRLIVAELMEVGLAAGMTAAMYTKLQATDASRVAAPRAGTPRHRAGSSRSGWPAWTARGPRRRRRAARCGRPARAGPRGSARPPQRHPRIVGAVDDEQRGPHRRDVGDRGRGSSSSRSCSSEPYSRSRNARRHSEVFSRNVTRSDIPTMSTPAAHSSGWNANPRAPCTRRTSRRRARPDGVEVRLGGQPVVQRGQVAHGVQPLVDVVEVLVVAAVARRPAHVGGDDREPLRDEVLRERRERRPVLALRPAVDHHDHRERPRTAVGAGTRTRAPRGRRTTEPHELGVDERGRVDRRTG
jgi:imidazolonepropionase-like amidohydrolase